MTMTRRTAKEKKKKTATTTVRRREGAGGRRNRCNCIDAAPFSLWPDAFLSFLLFCFFRHARTVIVDLPIDRYCYAGGFYEAVLRTHRGASSAGSRRVEPTLKVTTVRRIETLGRSLSFDRLFGAPATHPIAVPPRRGTKMHFFPRDARLYDGLRKRQCHRLKRSARWIRSHCQVTRHFALCPVFLRKPLTRFSPLTPAYKSIHFAGLKAGDFN